VQDDDSQDWAEMRSWLVWCLRDKLGDPDVLSGSGSGSGGGGGGGPAGRRSASPLRAASTTSRGPRGQLVRQQAVHDRSPCIGGVVDCSGPTPPTPGSAPVGGRHLLRCRSAETGGGGGGGGGYAGASLDSTGGSVAGRLAVDASCSGQSSFESYGSAG